MVVTIHQPDYIPWLGFFDRLRNSDVYIILDDVQFIRRGWHHRDKIKTPQGAQWLTIPVRKKGQYHNSIREMEIDYSRDWVRKHLRTLDICYSKAPHFLDVFPTISEIHEKRPALLVDLNMELIRFGMKVFQIECRILFSSDLGCPGTSTEKLAELVAAAGGTTYLSGTGARDYLDEQIFSDRNIQLKWQDYRHPIYSQLFGEFTKGLSFLDCVFMDPSAFNVQC